MLDFSPKEKYNFSIRETIYKHKMEESQSEEKIIVIYGGCGSFKQQHPCMRSSTVYG